MEYHGQFYLAGLAFAGEANGEAGEASGEAGEASGEAVVKHQTYMAVGGEAGEAISPSLVEMQKWFVKLPLHNQQAILETLMKSAQNQIDTQGG